MLTQHFYELGPKVGVSMYWYRCLISSIPCEVMAALTSPFYDFNALFS